MENENNNENNNPNNNKRMIIIIIAFLSVMVFAVGGYSYLTKNGFSATKGLNQNVNIKGNRESEIEVETEKGDVNEKEESASEEELHKAPEITIFDGEKSPVLMSSFEGEPTVVNFWASWCPPCKVEMPAFEKVYKSVGSDINFAMVDLVDGQGRETFEIGSNFIDNMGYTFPVYYDLDQEGSLNYQIVSIPSTFFINSNGYIVAMANGAIDESTLYKGIEMAKESTYGSEDKEDAEGQIEESTEELLEESPKE